MRLPFADDSFDAVVCQFAVMFFPDQTGAYTEIRRVLESGRHIPVQHLGQDRDQRVR